MDWIGKLLQIWSLKISKLSATQLAWKVEVKQIVELIDKHVLAEISTGFESFVYDRYFSGIKILSLPLRKRMNDILVYNILVIFDFLWINDFRKEQNRVAKSIQFFVQTFFFFGRKILYSNLWHLQLCLLAAYHTFFLNRQSPLLIALHVYVEN